MTTPNTSPIPKPRSNDEFLPPAAVEEPALPPVELPNVAPIHQSTGLDVRAEWEGRSHLRPFVQSAVDNLKGLFSRNPDRIGLDFRFIGFGSGQGKTPLDALDQHLQKIERPHQQSPKRHSRYWY
jgi:hypothetical protein